MSVTLYRGQLSQLSDKIRLALEMTGETLLSDLKRSQTLPYREGHLTSQTFLDRSQSGLGRVSIVSSTPYARRLYFHPEYNFRRDKNHFAGGLWYEPYKQGRKAWVQETFAEFLEVLF